MEFNTEKFYRDLEEMERQLLSEMNEEELKMVKAHYRDKRHAEQQAERNRYQEFVNWIFRDFKKNKETEKRLVKEKLKRMLNREKGR